MRLNSPPLEPRFLSNSRMVRTCVLLIGYQANCLSLSPLCLVESEMQALQKSCLERAKAVRETMLRLRERGRKQVSFNPT